MNGSETRDTFLDETEILVHSGVKFEDQEIR